MECLLPVESCRCYRLSDACQDSEIHVGVALKLKCLAESPPFLATLAIRTRDKLGILQGLLLDVHRLVLAVLADGLLGNFEGG